MKLSTKDKEFIEDHSQSYIGFLKKWEQCKSFNLGDYLVMYECDLDDTGKEFKKLVTNSYGLPRKFLVIHLEKQIPYLKEVNAKGRPYGEIISPLGSKFDEEYSYGGYWDYEFAVDPDFAEAVILDSKDQYHPTANHKHKSDQFKEISKYNKAIRIDTHDIVNMVKVAESLVPGQVLWTSNKNFLTFTSKRTMNLHKNKLSSYFLKPYKKKTVNEYVFAKSNGKTVVFNIADLHRKSLYSAQPRAFTELRDPNL